MINDMSAMKTGTSGWTPAIVAANKTIPHGGWVVAWSYGVVGDHSGLAIYSGIDADAFTDQLNPNYAVKELKLQLAAPFFRAPDPSCAPTCKPPGTSGGKPFAACSFAKPVPRGWVHRRVPIMLQTSVAAGITGKVLTRGGKALASASANNSGLLTLRVPTKRLRSNRTARLRAAVYLNGQQACSKAFRLKVDNVRPGLLSLATSRRAGRDLVTLRVSERSTVVMYGHGASLTHRVLPGRRLITLRLPANLVDATMILIDRAGNRLVRHLRWG